MSLKNASSITPHIIFRRNAVQSIPDVTWTQVAMNEVIADTSGGVWNNGTGGFILPPGLWQLWAHLSYVAISPTRPLILGLGTAIGDTNSFTDVRSLSNTFYDHGLEGSSIQRFQVNTNVNLYTFQNSGSAQNLFNNTPTSGYGMIAAYKISKI